MPRPYAQLYLHLVWATWDRLPMIDPGIEANLYAALTAEFRKMRCEPIALGGTSDHIHCLISFPVTLAVADIVKQAKGSTSHLMTHEHLGPDRFKWQGTYGCFTVQQSGLGRVCEYVENQKAHPKEGSLQQDWERTTMEPDTP